MSTAQLIPPGDRPLLRHRLAAPAMVVGGLLLVPWVLYLAGDLPHTARARNWSLMWAGLDIAEAVGLVLTGVLLWRRSADRAIPAAFTAALLAADAWIDVTTSAPGHARLMAIAMAAVIEIPAAVGCLLLANSAVRHLPSARPHLTGDRTHQEAVDGPAGEDRADQFCSVPRA